MAVPLVPSKRASAAKDIAAVLQPGLRAVLTTHVNADGDGVGSEVALWHLLVARGIHASIANPTGIPDRFAFLIPDGADASDR
ncbi:MAG: DHH family phosphoesterase, partial [Gemmatimonadetes bacterium]|nr:DHH family phosphoesterase [Gemmatimonadota bacterium]